MIFNATLSVIDLSIASTDDHVQLGFAVAAYLPTPQGDIPIPLGAFTVPISKEMAITKGQELISAGEGEAAEEDAPQRKTDLVIAKDLQGVEQVAKVDRKIKGKQ